MVTPFYGGGNLLSRVVPDVGMNEALARKWFRQVLLGLGFIHSKVSPTPRYQKYSLVAFYIVRTRMQDTTTPMHPDYRIILYWGYFRLQFLDDTVFLFFFLFFSFRVFREIGISYVLKNLIQIESAFFFRRLFEYGQYGLHRDGLFFGHATPFSPWPVYY